ncbi:polyketide cyclase [Actinophytocola xinjiangensis]|uniref:Polyketide cyclase n=1 Tax=Actinophytocola xinjiangensis TaxID=485602 RepID=A0A7Z0WR78_9PSEU|nr:SRPBCC domain-containing protein [Actinophytocola xinjiangensis]OLF12822.1 polyketide cyclase [Actinophytocola xinjiangensis]
MNTVKHSTFTLERTYAAPPARVFAAWADRDTKAKWYAAHDTDYTLDFRVGGTEATHGQTDDGARIVATSVYRDIRADERIVYTTLLHGRDVLATVSVTTVEFVPEGTGTHLVLTEQDTFLDDQELPDWRQQGTRDWLDALGREITGA